jgi:hypothetical protein
MKQNEDCRALTAAYNAIAIILDDLAETVDRDELCFVAVDCLCAYCQRDAMILEALAQRY